MVKNNMDRLDPEPQKQYSYGLYIICNVFTI